MMLSSSNHLMNEAKANLKHMHFVGVIISKLFHDLV